MRTNTFCILFIHENTLFEQLRGDIAFNHNNASHIRDARATSVLYAAAANADASGHLLLAFSAYASLTDCPLRHPSRVSSPATASSSRTSGRSRAATNSRSLCSLASASSRKRASRAARTCSKLWLCEERYASFHSRRFVSLGRIFSNSLVMISLVCSGRGSAR